MEIIPERCEGPLSDGLPHVAQESVHEAQVVYGRKPIRKQLFTFEEVMDICSRERAARVAITFRVKRTELVLEICMADIAASAGSVHSPVSRHSCRQHTVKHVYTMPDTLDKVLRRAHSHQVSWT